MKKRLTAMLWILAMLITLLPLGTFAAEGTAPERIFLSQSQVELQVGQQIALTAVVSPESAAEGAVWESLDPDIALVEDGVITAVSPGANKGVK